MTPAMKTLLPTTLLASLVFFSSSVTAQKQPVLADYDQELRTPDGHFDTPRTLAALKAMGCNSYFYLIHHSKYDWDDLPAFADAAAKSNINVWVHLNPWSETEAYKRGWKYSEPFRNDYVRWASEIAKLSLSHPNIVGFAIDDFYVNTSLPDREGFTPKYVAQMVDGYKKINPK